jgi:hypothetical protein
LTSACEAEFLSLGSEPFIFFEWGTPSDVAKIGIQSQGNSGLRPGVQFDLGYFENLDQLAVVTG